MKTYGIYVSEFPLTRGLVLDFLGDHNEIQAENEEEAIKLALQRDIKAALDWSPDDEFARDGLWVYVLLGEKSRDPNLVYYFTPDEENLKSYFVLDLESAKRGDFIKSETLKILFGRGDGLVPPKDSDWRRSAPIEKTEFYKDSYAEIVNNFLMKLLPHSMYASAVWVKNERTGEIKRFNCHPVIEHFSLQEDN